MEISENSAASVVLTLRRAIGKEKPCSAPIAGCSAGVPWVLVFTLFRCSVPIAGCSAGVPWVLVFSFFRCSVPIAGCSAPIAGCSAGMTWVLVFRSSRVLDPKQLPCLAYHKGVLSAASSDQLFYRFIQLLRPNKIKPQDERA